MEARPRDTGNPQTTHRQPTGKPAGGPPSPPPARIVGPPSRTNAHPPPSLIPPPRCPAAPMVVAAPGAPCVRAPSSALCTLCLRHGRRVLSHSTSSPSSRACPGWQLSKSCLSPLPPICPPSPRMLPPPLARTATQHAPSRRIIALFAHCPSASLTSLPPRHLLKPQRHRARRPARPLIASNPPWSGLPDQQRSATAFSGPSISGAIRTIPLPRSRD